MLSEDEIAMLSELGSSMTPTHEVALILMKDQSFAHLLESNKFDEPFINYWSAYYLANHKVRKAIVESAAQGSTPAARLLSEMQISEAIDKARE